MHTKNKAASAGTERGSEKHCAVNSTTAYAHKAKDADLAARLGSAAAQAVRKSHTLTGTIPTRARSAHFTLDRLEVRS